MQKHKQSYWMNLIQFLCMTIWLFNPTIETIWLRWVFLIIGILNFIAFFEILVNNYIITKQTKEYHEYGT